MLGGEPNMLNKWKQDHNLDDIEVRKVLDLTLLVSVIYGERRDVDMAGTTLYKELTERKAMNKPAEKVDTAAEEDGGNTTHNTHTHTHTTQHKTRNTQHTTHNTQHAPHTTHKTQHTTHNTPHNIQHTTRNTQRTTHTHHTHPKCYTNLS